MLEYLGILQYCIEKMLHCFNPARLAILKQQVHALVIENKQTCTNFDSKQKQRSILFFENVSSDLSLKPKEMFENKYSDLKLLCGLVLFEPYHEKICFLHL